MKKCASDMLTDKMSMPLSDYLKKEKVKMKRQGFDPDVSKYGGWLLTRFAYADFLDNKGKNKLAEKVRISIEKAIQFYEKREYFVETYIKVRIDPNKVVTYTERRDASIAAEKIMEKDPDNIITRIGFK